MSALITTAKHIPILFSTPMVQALLAGRKTQTRRIVKDIPENTISMHYDEATGWWKAKESGTKNIRSTILKCPYGRPGDILWVRENTLKERQIDNLLNPAYRKTIYVADLTQNEYVPGTDLYGYNSIRPSIHMPKKDCRLFLELTGVWAERLYKITHDDAIAEGVISYPNVLEEVLYYHDYTAMYASVLNCPIRSYQTLWKSLNGIESWDANPWVWVLEFKQIEKPLNF
jgi:hypothetical protein